LIGGGVMALGLIEALVVLLLHATVVLAVPGLVVALAAGMYANGGRAGFYEVEEDGSLGAYLGRSKPDLDSMRARKP
jgi:hypothetical protein